jgi:hypothetical protein
MDTIVINGEEYIKKSALSKETQMADKLDGLEYVMCRTYSAGVFAGYLEKRKGQEVTLIKARRIWKWAGAASLSQLATDGTSNPSECKFPKEVDKVLLLQAIEIIPITQKAKKSIEGVAEWSQ